MANDGLRVLGIAWRPMEELPEQISPDIERGLELIGLIGILDPARPEAKVAVQRAREAGIRTIMITGDHALTAEAIARDLGIIDVGQKAITGSELDTLTEQELETAARETSCFARVSPAHKIKLVQVLQKQDNIVAMTGDGVNDAPALKQADIGVAMGITGADVSKGASEMILTDDNFRSIVAAIEEGRAIYDNIKKFIKYMLSSNVGEILVMFVALLDQSADSAARYSDSLDKSRHRWLAGDRARIRTGGKRRHETATPADQRKHFRPGHGFTHRPRRDTDRCFDSNQLRLGFHHCRS